MLGDPSAFAVKGNIFFVTNQNDGTVGEYNATTGALIKADFVKGLEYPPNLAVEGDTIFVLNGNGAVGKYDAITGAVIDANFITGLAAPSESWSKVKTNAPDLKGKEQTH